MHLPNWNLKIPIRSQLKIKCDYFKIKNKITVQHIPWINLDCCGTFSGKPAPVSMVVESKLGGGIT